MTRTTGGDLVGAGTTPDGDTLATMDGVAVGVVGGKHLGGERSGR